MTPKAKKKYYIDPAELEAALAAMSAQLAGPAREPGFTGDQARIKQALLPAFERHVAAEINRGGLPSALLCAVASLCADMIANVVDMTPPERRDALTADVIVKAVQFLKQRRDGGSAVIFEAAVGIQRGSEA